VARWQVGGGLKLATGSADMTIKVGGPPKLNKLFI
jgi:hypothetical protein